MTWAVQGLATGSAIAYTTCMLHPTELAHIAGGKLIGGEVVPLAGGVLLYHPAMTSRSYNNIACAGLTDLPELLSYASSWFPARGRQPYVSVSDFHADADTVLSSAGWRVREPRQLFMTHNGVPCARPADVMLKRLAPEHVAEFVAILGNAFGWDADECDRQRKLYAHLTRNGLGRHYVALHNGLVVSTASVLGAGTTWGIYKVATLPGYRGRGIAASLVRHALSEAYASGAQTIFLYTMLNGPAVPLYERLGFRPAFCRTLYAAPSS